LRVLAARWIELSPDAGAHLVLGTATISVLGWERQTPAITRWNATN
jgi:probable phosphoglycerate mutase